MTLIPVDSSTKHDCISIFLVAPPYLVFASFSSKHFTWASKGEEAKSILSHLFVFLPLSTEFSFSLSFFCQFPSRECLTVYGL